MSLHRISKNIRFLFLILLVFSAVNLNLEYPVKLINQHFKPYLLIHQFPVGRGMGDNISSMPISCKRGDCSLVHGDINFIMIIY